MGVSIRTIRVGLVAGAALLTITLAILLGYAHLRAHLLGRGVAKRLGIDIRQETNGFTYSQSQRGKTVFTIHAAKAVQRQDGKVTLHDVGIVLYGRDGGRADRIYGDEFEYDQSTGEARATGEVRIDLQAPAAAFRGKAEGGIHETELLPGPGDDRIVHVRTRGLVFQQKVGLASTPGLIEFSSGGLNGRAVGAVYDAQTGKIVLESAVEMDGLVKNRPGHLTAAHGEFEQSAHRVLLAQAHYTTPDQGLAADQVVVETAADGGPRSLEAAGHVLVTEGQERVSAGRMDVALSQSGKPRESHLYGDVQFSKSGMEGRTADARISFDSEGRAGQVLLDGKVTGEERGPVATRTLAADRAEFTMVPTGPGRSVVRLAKATGRATLQEVRSDGKTARREMAADALRAEFAVANGISRITSLTGSGHTVLHQVATDGTDERSSGESLTAKFGPGNATKRGSQTLLSAVQRGGVKTVRALGRRGETQQSEADEASYDAVADRVLLRGRAQVENGNSAVYAETIVSDRVSGETEAQGEVRVSYVQQGTGEGKETKRPEPVHVLADRATMQKDQGTAYFYGTPGRPARMWNAGSQVEAPVLEFLQTSRRLIARADGAAGVHALLTNDSDARGAEKNRTESSGGLASRLVRVVSDELVYSDGLREAELTGHVHVQDAEGTVTAQHATVYLADKPGSTAALPAGAAALPEGQVQRIVATGEVRVEQPDRHGEGERLVYTAADKTFVMTGTKAAPPRFFDQTRGTVTGASLRFRSGDQAVLVSGGDGVNGPKRVRTETRVKQ